jgi:hypothetical protein
MHYRNIFKPSILLSGMSNGKMLKIREKVKKELEHIPKGDMFQNWIRQVFFNLRMNSLGKKAKYPDDKDEVLKLAIEDAKKFAKANGTELNPKYDKTFFKLNKK